MLIFWGNTINKHSGFTHNQVDYVPKVTTPVLMPPGTADERATLAHAQAVYDQLNGPKQFEVFEGVGHESYVTGWTTVVTQFLAE